MTALAWRRWQRNFHTADAEGGTWRVVKPIVLEPWEIWFQPKGSGPTGRRAKKGRFVTTAKTLAAAKTAIESGRVKAWMIQDRVAKAENALDKTPHRDPHG
jgi:hypothetical protein